MILLLVTPHAADTDTDTTYPDTKHDFSDLDPTCNIPDHSSSSPPSKRGLKRLLDLILHPLFKTHYGSHPLLRHPADRQHGDTSAAAAAAAACGTSNLSLGEEATAANQQQRAGAAGGDPPTEQAEDLTDDVARGGEGDGGEGGRISVPTMESESGTGAFHGGGSRGALGGPISKLPPERKGHKAKRHAIVPHKFSGAGGLILPKTNVPDLPSRKPLDVLPPPKLLQRKDEVMGSGSIGTMNDQPKSNGALLKIEPSRAT